MILFDNANSSNAFKIRILLAELGLEYERREVPLPRPRPDELMAINPLGGLPTLVDGDLHLAESNTIARYLARREARNDLYPTDPVDAARVDEFLDRFSLTFRPAFFAVERAALGFVVGKGWGAKEPDPQEARAAAAEGAPMLTLLEGLVASNGTVFGSMNIADMATAPALMRTTGTGMDMGPYPKLTAIRDSMAARPCVIAAGPFS